MVRRLTQAQEIAKWIMKESVSSTSEGNWITYYDEIEDRFGVCLVLGGQLEADIVAALYEVYHDVILDMTYGCNGTGQNDPCFDIDLGLAYCPNYVWHDGDEEIFGSYEEFENRAIMPLPLEED